MNPVLRSLGLNFFASAKAVLDERNFVTVCYIRYFYEKTGTIWTKKNHLEQGGFLGGGGERGIRTPDRAINPILP